MDRLRIFWQMSRTDKRILSVCIDTVLICIALQCSLWARFGDWRMLTSSDTWGVQGLLVILTVMMFTRLGLYRAILRYLTFKALFTITLGAIGSAAILMLFSVVFFEPLPKTTPVIYCAFLALLCGGPRIIVRSLIASSSPVREKQVLIYGAGSAGRQLAVALGTSGKYQVRAFIDKDPTLTNTTIMGLPVIQIEEVPNQLDKHEIHQILMAIPSASRARKKTVLALLAPLKVKIRTVPDMTDIVSGQANIDEIKEVPLEDLLGRDPVEPNLALLDANIRGKVVMVTGAGGSIGSELCRQILRQEPKVLILFDLSEHSLYLIDQDLSRLKQKEGLDIEVVPLIGSVQRAYRLESVMKSFHVQTVYHAAAYKHVPLVEYNVVEGVRNNVFGTYYTAKAAIDAGVESFVLISTDKAVRPTNVMGTTKRLAELGLQALAKDQAKQANGTRFCMVRFGNVLGSSGSVIPLFKQQIASGGPVTVTHPDITRYFMTIPEAAQLVIQAGAMGKGGDVFVLDMGEPVKILELAENLVQLSGLEVKSEDNPFGDIAIHFSGLRPGEKLYEELLIGDNVLKTAHKRIMRANEVCLPMAEFTTLLGKIDQACHGMDYEMIRDLMLEAPTGFCPTDGIGDLVWQHQEDALNEGVLDHRELH
ncbi:nucleoside-diphosphate sugar epimerase [Vibrio sp. 10N.286.49.B3]|uniref:polysaccharide biosynthesis protein n=1 Tax=Vibrio sp. 10N.286.49.B3 TaxID=1880855 RepID=UPI000C823A13|nr:nucleoside-diphosphate sugar epimerase/dehydratase [Vibrio sp. 10N.286.49.B3]PMH45944.1 nucleoside-diphosphate sugar epimerase [Vibrio sp. 10N.286.49.B3]